VDFEDFIIDNNQGWQNDEDKKTGQGFGKGCGITQVGNCINHFSDNFALSDFFCLMKDWLGRLFEKSSQRCFAKNQARRIFYKDFLFLWKKILDLTFYL